jgi:multicomponent K+:H+ antiporter subunit E
MKRWLPFPILSLGLLALWLILNATLAPAHVLLGLLVGIAGGKVFARLERPGGSVRLRAGTLIALACEVLLDVVRSNLAVGRIAFAPVTRGRTAGFLAIPLELRHRGGLAILACIVTATPGTSWARYDAGRSILTLHVLDLRDEQAWVRQFKARYERRLLEIFQ